MSLLSLERVGHAFLGRTILENVDLDIGAGEVVALVGPSGCGKSTLAHIAAGLTEARSGRVRTGYARHAMIFQEPALMPWATARDNIEFVLKLANLGRKGRTQRIQEVAEAVKLTDEDLAKYPTELSGGMKQRVAIARALAPQPEFIFFDEPFTALDVALKRRMQDLVIDLCGKSKLAGLFITHDLMEAARVADRIAVLDAHGRGIRGMRDLPGRPVEREDAWVFDWTHRVLAQDPLFKHIHDVDERQIA